MLLNLKRLLSRVLIFTSLCTSYSVFADQQACISYQRADYSWSHGYKVTGKIVSGYDLNMAIGRYQYESIKYYLFVPFDNGGYVNLEIPIGNFLSPIETDTKDQQGNNWRMKAGWTICY